MKIFKTKIEDCLIIDSSDDISNTFESSETFNQEKFNKIIGKKIDFVQDNLSKSIKGTLRGLHIQKGANMQSKLVRVISGTILDVVVDLRSESSTFGRHFSIELSDQNQKQLFIPKGCAHGFVVLSNVALFFYKCDNYYNQKSESGIIYNDLDLKIDWKLNEEDIILSEKDKNLPSFSEWKKNSI